MQRSISDGEDEPLVDTTLAIPLHSKRTSRMQRKQEKRDKKQKAKPTLDQLPTEIVLEILKYVRPSEVFDFSLVNRRFRSLVQANANVIGDSLIRRRYPLVVQCFPLPRKLCDLESSVQALLMDPKRQQQKNIHKAQYQHIQMFDPQVLCSCLTCILAWNNLSLILDFAHWQNNLDGGQPIPMIPRGQSPLWNRELVNRHADMVRAALNSPLWHARILERHLASMVRSIKRHRANKGNKRRHVEMSTEEAASGTDEFLEKNGPASDAFPFHRDEYYMLESYMPLRWWKTINQKWIYLMPGSHDSDIAYLIQGKQRVTGHGLFAEPISTQ
ncbi:hypothetical protein B0J11DRAFT_557105 [Dendryphion nanum]|uniref:F-box domain-containing protein n=1 Tax=Dendryphion nanum TaxID=256645 RepID=A0A9P9E8B3_9PLEO|nr:hypothetical protein B0J11DRAFT_557105 [Dendryphion nanum]